MDNPAGQQFFQQSLAAEMSAMCQQANTSLVILRHGNHQVGAGLIWDQGGTIVTNYHVVRKNSPRVFTLDGREYAAEILGWDKWNDLALLQVAASRPLVPILRADSRRLRVGQFALAVGHPWGQIGSVSAGIITSFGRIQIRGQQQALDLVRTDARLAPGNSGGPLLNAKGQMIGINTMIMGGDLGVAIPTHIVDEFVAQKIGRDM